MARKKKSVQVDETTDGSPASPLLPCPSLTPSPSPSPCPCSGPDTHTSTSTSTGTSTGSGTARKTKKTATSALIICRNKHWRYISSFHGPWLQLPPEVLESLAHSNYLAPRPHPIDPAVFFDLLKIRRAVDEATNLAVRATSGLTSAALSSSLHAANGMLGTAAALGIGYGGGGGTSKLSRERKHRMRELATAKLSQAYHLDEIAASVATMQSASTLEDVAHLVLQRSPADVDAQYVHFFHEKIPSRMMAQSTPLAVLDAIIADRPHDASPLRTRALTRIFKDDYLGAAKDLSAALSVARFLAQQHRAGRDQLVLANAYQDHCARDWRNEVKISDDDQPSSLETQLLFHRAGVYFTIACRHVHTALDGLREAEEAAARRDALVAAGQEPPPHTPDEAEGNRRRADARKQVRQNAKRALRDYIAFLSHFDYTPGISPSLAEEFLRRLGTPTSTNRHPPPPPSRLLDSPSNPSAAPISEALVPHRRPNGTDRASWPKLPPPEVFKVSQLFDTVPPSSLPPYPAPPAQNAASAAATAFADSHESITYHPLITDALHSLLLCHALLQTPAKEHARHAHNAARCARVCDGYPIFLAARSPARADWIEVLRRASNWIGLHTSWENLCRPAPLPSSKNGGIPSSSSTPKESLAQKRERQKHEAILEALADERVVDEESFQRAVRARERRNQDDEEADKSSWSSSSYSQNGNATNSSGEPTSPSPSTSTSTSTSTSAASSVPKRWAQDDGREYPISTERAEAITRWVRDAPPITEGSGKKRRTKGRGKIKEKNNVDVEMEVGVEMEDGACEPDLVASLETLSVQGEEEVE